MFKIYSIAQNPFQQRETKDRHIGIILLPFKFDFSLVTGISVCISARAKLHRRAIFRRNRSNRGRYNYGDFSIFQDGGRRHLGFLNLEM